MPDGGTSSAPRPPAQLGKLVDAIGLDGVLRLLECRGGTVVYVPRRMSPRSGLGRQLGLDADACARMRHLHGDDKLKVPLSRAWRAQVYRYQGLSYTQIALRLGVTETTVWAYLRDAGLTNQPRLAL